MAAAAPLLSGRRILVVEDEYFIADDMTKLLERVGAQVIGPLSTVEDALRHLSGHSRVDAAVLDIDLHGETVYPVADALRRRNVPFVFATGYGGTSIPAGYADVLRWEKPFDAIELVRALPGLMA